ncbi:MAG TPA: aminopeptidase [Fimbriimonadales bacterium]|jgi:aminopeptidase|nr:aminopeptidase [Fimbriimonadales bacterium]
MLDPRVTSLAELLAGHSLSLGPKDNVLIEAFDIEPDAVAEVVRVAQAAGAGVFVQTYLAPVARALQMGMTEQNAKLYGEIDGARMDKMTAYIGLRGTHNFAEMSDIPAETTKIWSKNYMTPVHFQRRVPNTKWVVLRWPSAGMAQQAQMSTRAFEDFYFRVCTLDYKKMEEACLPLRDLMAKTDRVHITGPGTDLRFSIAGIGAIPCVGKRNVPDGECFTAPVKDSIEGVLQYNTSTMKDGKVFKDPRLTLKAGKIIDVDAGEGTEAFNAILDTDEGARYVGEWSLGFNPFILTPMLDTLFDEKISGSFHFTPGNAYDEADNGNRSSVHWDMVCIQRPEFGGGEIRFDDILIRKDGLFVLPELEGLNPDSLASPAPAPEQGR